MNSKPRERFVDSDSGRRGRHLHARLEERPQARAGERRARATCSPPSPRSRARELKPHNVPDTNPVATSADSIKHGEEIFLERCTGCHGRKADGKGPNSLDITPRPRNLRNSAFVASVNDRRLFDSILYGVQGTAMPSWIDYGLSQERRRGHCELHPQHQSKEREPAECRTITPQRPRI